MKQILIKIGLIISIISISNGFSQSLQEMIQEALVKNYQINIVKNEARIAANNNVIGNTGMLPSVDFNGNYSNSFNNTKQQFADGTVREGDFARNTNLNLSLLANWTVFNGFSVYAKQDQLGYFEDLGELNTKFYIEQTVSDIVTAYHQIAYEKQILTNYKQSLKISLFRANLERKRKEIGTSNAVDYGQALVDYQTDSIRFLSQQVFIEELKFELNNILNNELESDVLINENDFIFLPIPPKDSLIERANNANKLLAQQILQELISETELRIAKANRSPKVNLFGGVEYSGTTAAVGFVNANQSYGPVLGVSVSFNLFNGGAINRTIKNTAIETENRQLTKNQVKQKIHTDVLSIYTKYNTIVTQITLAESNVAEMRKVSEIAKLQFSKGAINGYEFRLTQLTLLNSEQTLHQLKYALKVLEITVNRLSGRVLESYI